MSPKINGERGKDWTCDPCDVNSNCLSQRIDFTQFHLGGKAYLTNETTFRQRFGFTLNQSNTVGPDGSTRIVHASSLTIVRSYLDDPHNGHPAHFFASLARQRFSHDVGSNHILPASPPGQLMRIQPRPPAVIQINDGSSLPP